MESVRVELVGMLPELYRICPKGSALCALEPGEAQMGEYPQEVLANQAACVEIYNRLLGEFGGRAVPISVSTMSLRGLWLSFKHRLGQQLTVVVGADAIPLEAGYERVRSAVRSALGLGA